MNQEGGKPRILRDSNFRVILGIVVMSVIGGSLVAPILPSMIEPLGTNEETVGLVMSVYTFAALISTPFIGVLADRHGRKRVLLPLIVLYGIAGFSVSQAGTFYQVLILRAFQGIGGAGMMSLGVTLIGDIFSGRARAQAMGYRSSSQSFVNAGIPFISGTVATVAWFYPFYIYILAFPLALVTYLYLDVEEHPSQSTLGSYFRSIFKVMRFKRTLWVYISNLFVFILLFGLIVYVPILIVRELGLSTMYSGLTLSIGSAVAAVTATQAGRFFYRFKNHQLVIAGFLLCGIALLLISFVTSFIFLIPCIIIWGMGFGTVFPALNTIVTELVSSQLRAGVVSGFTTMTYIGQTISPPLFGFILSQSNLQAVFVAGSLLALLPLAFTLITRYVFKVTGSFE
ncbi:MAG TPA: MFS transporter [Bacteroidales bacterium]|nr:MFS transporter [Bacteroidales bacterium]